MVASPAGATAFTHPGRRRTNQDAVVVRSLGAEREVVAVADGMGGQAAGEVASSRTLEVLLAELEAGTGLAAAVRAANTVVHRDATDHAEWRGMGTTLVAMLRVGNTYTIANVGDSRAYRVTAAGAEQITVDHSFAAEALREGRMSEAEAAASPWRNALTRALGTEPDVEVDLFGPFSTEPAHAVVLCSDGVYKALPDDAIGRYVLGTGTVESAAEALASLAFRRGSDDNISVATVEFGRLPRRSPSVTLPIAIARQSGVRAEPPPAPPVAAPRPPRFERQRGSGSERRDVLVVAAVIVGSMATVVAAWLWLAS